MKLATIATTAALGLALAGCVSVDDLRHTVNDPSFYGATPRTAQDYTTCVVEAWQGQGGEVQRSPIQDGFEVSYSSRIGAEALLSAITWRGRTDVKLFLRKTERGQSLIDSANLCM